MNNQLDKLVIYPNIKDNLELLLIFNRLTTTFKKSIDNKIISKNIKLIDYNILFYTFNIITKEKNDKINIYDTYEELILINEYEKSNDYGKIIYYLERYSINNDIDILQKIRLYENFSCLKQNEKNINLINDNKALIIIESKILNNKLINSEPVLKKILKI